MLTLSAYRAKAILEGVLSLIPGGLRLFRGGTRGSDSARYCYAVWLRHLVRTGAYRRLPLDGTVVELGPGDSVGMGLAALLSGARRYVAIDVVRHADVGHNLAVLDELVGLFGRREPVPGSEEFSAIRPDLDDYAFPGAILAPEAMAANLASDRVAAIAAALRGDPAGDPTVRYVDPAMASRLIAPASVDWVFSQAVLEHVDDLRGVYRACYDWLKPGGLMSHQIDFESHGTSRVWNGHWAYPDLVWRLLRGRRTYLLNREPYGTHMEQMADAGFEILAVERVRQPSSLRQDQLARRFRGIATDDLTTSGAFVIARKPVGDDRGR
jgi:SAM-dependent methyltransferase